MKILGNLKIVVRKSHQVINYIENSQLPFKELFVPIWTDLHMHFANGAHSTKHLQVWVGSFVEVKNEICLVVYNQFQEIKIKLSTEKAEFLVIFIFLFLGTLFLVGQYFL